MEEDALMLQRPITAAAGSGAALSRRKFCSEMGLGVGLGMALGLLGPGRATAATGEAAGPLKFVSGRVGDIAIARVEETVTYMPVRSWFPKLDPAALAPYLSWLAPHYYEPATGLFPMPMQSWIMQSGSTTILVDTGYGNDKDRDGFADANRLRTPYLSRLAAVGVTPEMVDLVICTHLHLDHSGWNTRLEGGRWVPTFPNARYIWTRADQAEAYDLATGTNAFPFTRNVYADSVLPIIEAGLAHPIDGPFRLDKNLVLRPSPGHSRGNMRIEIASNGHKAVMCGDILHSPLQIPLWQTASAGDGDPAMAAAARRELLEYCVREKALLIAGHFAAPHAARITTSDRTFLPDFSGFA